MKKSFRRLHKTVRVQCENTLSDAENCRLIAMIVCFWCVCIMCICIWAKCLN